MSRSRLRRCLKRKQDASTKRPLATGFRAAAGQLRKEKRQVQPEESTLLASYSDALTAHAAHLEQIQGHKDVSAVEGFVGCASIISAILKACWRDEAHALGLAARAVLLSRSFLKEFLEASGGALEGNEQLRLARSMHGLGTF